jgi:citrate synthase
MQAGGGPIQPDPVFGHAANFLYMLTGERPSGLATRAFDIALILHADHELNASTFAARTVSGTLSDSYSAITAAVAALKGARHGGAIDQVPGMLAEIGSPEHVPAYVDRALAQRRRLPGFGHRVYRQRDPRAALQAEVVQHLSLGSANATSFAIARRLEEELLERKGLPANVDYYAAVALDQLGFPPALMTSFIASTRVAGWTAHILEQFSDNRLIRPRARYIGPRRLPYPPPETLDGARLP